jgi:hypothetical protein
MIMSPGGEAYIHNFENPRNPQPIALPAGQAVVFRADVERLVKDIKERIPALFESEEYRARRKKLEDEHREKQEQGFSEIQESSQSEGLSLVQTPEGYLFAPSRSRRINTTLFRMRKRKSWPAKSIGTRSV